jgi:hypothetical protein
VAQENENIWRSNAMNNKKKNKRRVWVAVRVDRGLPAEVRIFQNRAKAVRSEQVWRMKMNLDYEDTGVFRVTVR